MNCSTRLKLFSYKRLTAILRPSWSLPENKLLRIVRKFSHQIILIQERVYTYQSTRHQSHHPLVLWIDQNYLWLLQVQQNWRHEPQSRSFPSRNQLQIWKRDKRECFWWNWLKKEKKKKKSGHCLNLKLEDLSFRFGQVKPLKQSAFFFVCRRRLATQRQCLQVQHLLR